MGANNDCEKKTKRIFKNYRMRATACKKASVWKGGEKELFYYLMVKKCALPGNRTRVARMGILHDTTTPAVLPCQPEVKN